MDKKIYNAPILEVIYYSEDDIMTANESGIELPDHEW